MSPVPRRVALPRWLNRRLMLGAALVLLSVAGSARVVAGAQRTVPVVAAARALAVGTTITTSEVMVVRVRLSAAARARYAADPAAVIGRQVARPLAADELVPVAALHVQPAAVTVVVPLPPDSAPVLAAGQRVSIWLTAPSCSTRLLMADVPVQSVHENRAASFAAAGGQTVVLQIAPDLAERVMVALAIEDVQLRAARVDGATALWADLTDLAPCAVAAK
ncbi:MAG TPA: SAF domain-containing protein [Jatrophihabitantaceae bacterium]|nr:SAF domain-containing protein [Jatrophihabitantaceae bacterium]